MTKQEMVTVVRPGMLRILREHGWYGVYNEDSGVLWKDGNWLVFGLALNEESKQEKGFVRICGVTQQPEVVHGKWGGWFVERDGFVIKIGSVPTAVIPIIKSATECTEKQVQEFESFLQEIEEAASMDYGQALSCRYGMRVYEIPCQKQRFVKSDRKLRDTLMLEIADGISGIKGGYYQVINVCDGKINFVRVNLDEEQRNLVVVDMQNYVIDASGLQTLLGSKYARVVELQRYQSSVSVDGFGRLSEYDIDKIPKEFLDYGLTEKQLMMLGYGIKKCVNVIPLLDRKAEYTVNVIDAMNAPVVGLDNLVGKGFDQRTLEGLTYTISRQYNLQPYLQEGLDREYLDIMISDFEQELRERCGSTFDGAKIMFSYGREGECLEDFVRFRGEQEGLHNTAEIMLSNGICAKDEVKLPWRYLDNKKELFAYFALEGYSVGGKSWSAMLTGIFENATYLKFDLRLGFMIVTRYGNFGRDDNGVILYFDDGTARWRTVSVNEKVVGYGDDSAIALIAERYG